MGRRRRRARPDARPGQGDHVLDRALQPHARDRRRAAAGRGSDPVRDDGGVHARERAQPARRSRSRTRTAPTTASESVLTVPKGMYVPGPEQADAAIDQDPRISQFFAWWSRKGLEVVRGHTTLLPIGDEVIYVEPVFLRSRQLQVTQLKKVVVVYRGRPAMRDTLAEALRAAVAGAPSSVETPPGLDDGAGTTAPAKTAADEPRTRDGQHRGRPRRSGVRDERSGALAATCTSDLDVPLLLRPGVPAPRRPDLDVGNLELPRQHPPARPVDQGRRGGVARRPARVRSRRSGPELLRQVAGPDRLAAGLRRRRDLRGVLLRQGAAVPRLRPLRGRARHFRPARARLLLRSSRAPRAPLQRRQRRHGLGLLERRRNDDRSRFAARLPGRGFDRLRDCGVRGLWPVRDRLGPVAGSDVLAARDPGGQLVVLAPLGDVPRGRGDPGYLAGVEGVARAPCGESRGRSADCRFSAWSPSAWRTSPHT